MSDPTITLEEENAHLRELLGAYCVPLSAKPGVGVRPCTCRLVRLQSHLEPEEWEQDPECDQHGDIRYIKAQRELAESRLEEACVIMREMVDRHPGWSQAVRAFLASLSVPPKKGESE